MGEIIEVIKTNIQKNAKKLAGILGDIITSILAVSLFVMQGQLDLVTGLMMILFAVKPFLYTYITLVFKNTEEVLIIENDLLKQQLVYLRELSEYKVQLAAKDGKVPSSVMANSDWVEANEKIEEIEKKVADQ